MNQAANRTRLLFDTATMGRSRGESKKQLTRLNNPVWTESKALLIRRYMQLFVMITKSGTYIDAFTGPQYPDKPQMWAAKLVLENTPKRLRHFHLFEMNRKKYKLLSALAEEHRKAKGRTVETYQRDCNAGIRELLARDVISETEPTFCLLDQHTFECEWQTVKALAQHKKRGLKIELFYFLANGWLPRALHAVKDPQKLNNWWGGTGWDRLLPLDAYERGNLMAARFRKELGYRHADPYPIFGHKRGKAGIMYSMIHATDHDEAPVLMGRSYRTLHNKGREHWRSVQAPLLGETWMLETRHDGSHTARCAKCLTSSMTVDKDASRAVAQLRFSGWIADRHDRWICPECNSAPKPGRRPRA